jgi:hypothetical protein
MVYIAQQRYPEWYLKHSYDGLFAKGHWRSNPYFRGKEWYCRYRRAGYDTIHITNVWGRHFA